MRHPLQEQVLDTFVPNDVRLVGGVGFGMCYEDDASDVEPEAAWSSVVLCTGANACGKVSTLPISLSSNHLEVSLAECIFKTGQQTHCMILITESEVLATGCVDSIYGTGV